MRLQGQLFALLFTLCTGGSPLAAPAHRKAESFDRYIVEFETPSLVAAATASPEAYPRLRNGSFDFGADQIANHLALLDAEHAAFEEALAGSVAGARVERFFDVLFDGAVVSGASGVALSELPGVLRAVPADTVRADMASNDPLDAVDVEILWDSVGGLEHAGEGVRIAIIDSGIDAENAFFDPTGFAMPKGFPRGEKAFTTPKVIAARSYFRPEDPVDTSVDSADAADRLGHGSSSAGVAAGISGLALDLYGTALDVGGVAPRAHLMSYKVFYASASGSTSASDAELMAAFEDAVLDGAQIISCSWGGPQPLLRDTPSEIVFRAASRAGAIVVFAAGNEGGGPGTITYPGTLEEGLTVGAFSTGRAFAGLARISGEETIPSALREVAAVRGTISPAFSDAPVGPATLVSARAIDGGSVALGCEPFPAFAFSGAVALIERGECAFSQKVGNAAAAGAIAVVVYNNAPGEPPTTMGGDAVAIPAVQVGNPEGAMLDELLSHEDGIQVELIDTMAPYFLPDEAWNVSRFSGRGPTDATSLKPDIAAPGEAIVSANAYRIGTDGREWVIASGTSMAASFAAGAAAVLRGSRPTTLAPDEVSAIITSIASTERTTSSEASILDRGAGYLSFSNADEPPFYAIPRVISFGEARAGESLEAEVTIGATAPDQALSLFWRFDDDRYIPTTVPSNGAVIAPGTTTALTLSVPLATPGGERNGTLSLSVGQGPWARTLDVPFHFRVIPPIRRDLLLLDLSFLEQQQEGLVAVYRGLATKAGLDYDVLRVDAADEDSAPKLALLEGYEAVLAFTGNDQTAHLGAAGIRALDVLSTYAARGGRVIVTGQGALRKSVHSRLFGILGGRTADAFPFFDPYTQEVAQLEDFTVRVSEDLFPKNAEPAIAEVDLSPSNGGSGDLEFVGEIEEVFGPGLTTSLTRPVLLMDDPVFAGGVGTLGTLFDPFPAYGDFPEIEALSHRAVLLGFGLERVGDSGPSLDSLELFEAIYNWVIARIEVEIEAETSDLHVIVDASTSGGDLFEYVYDFGDGSSPLVSDDPRVYYEYAEPGEYEIRVLARSTLGAADVARTTVEVPTDEPPSTDSETDTGDGEHGITVAVVSTRGTRDCACAVVGSRESGAKGSLLRFLTWGG